jgi:hypothetical protein
MGRHFASIGHYNHDTASTLAEGDGRTLIVSQQEMGPAKQAPDHLKREIRELSEP